ncbi:hypothetical protein LI90_2582 [Carbonactinospora thermoautotrophica]|uniref:ER-bound oxygenase mpaB/mpaB'/Rubber oxygenase catalytic domain-containing protein n=1 Tax=Carbonactinospora thermoautotrophica TaxID=1469144 RepID=A0A132MV18_9ACTN|nr:oxygenase MpaB family protein [Carbonactinospora thermoautotrophica]KWX01550.1 hypothetical protein LI90_2582 [Carbonactinospora thermoautotrophica]
MTGDPGLFGPFSVTWHLHADPMMWLAGVRALYLQALHPVAVRGVLQNSDFRADPWGRLMRTAEFVGVRTYGTREEAETAAARVRRVHRALRVHDPDSGRVHRVDEPELLRWIHCAEIGSYLHVVRRAGLRLTDAQADRYVAEQRRSAALVGLDEAPGSVAELEAYFAAVRPVLRAAPEALEILRFLHRPRIRPLTAPLEPVLWTPLSHVAYSALPAWARELYGRPGLSEAATTRALRVLRRAALMIPARLRWRLPSPLIPAAITRLGPAATPSARGLAAVGSAGAVPGSR